jgi:hypothetical protein
MQILSLREDMTLKQRNRAQKTVAIAPPGTLAIREEIISPLCAHRALFIPGETSALSSHS